MVDIEYYENLAISQSQLKLLLGTNPGLFNTIQEPEMYFEEKEHFVIGSAVDCALTTPYLFDSRYYVSTLESKPSGVVKSIIQQVKDKLDEQQPFSVIYSDITMYPELILEACENHNYYSNLSNSVKVLKISSYNDYFRVLVNAIDKVILSVEEKTLIDNIVMSIRTNEATSKYFLSGIYGSYNLFQVPIYFTYEDVECKALLDMVVVDTMNMTMQPIDIKTLGYDTLKFHNSLIKRRYDIQAAFYTEALKQEYPGYTILPFKFIVESTVRPGTPLIYTCTEDLLEVGKYGKKESYSIGINSEGTDLVKKNEKVLGFHDLILLYKYYLLNGFIKNKKVVENDSELLIDWNGII